MRKKGRCILNSTALSVIVPGIRVRDTSPRTRPILLHATLPVVRWMHGTRPYNLVGQIVLFKRDTSFAHIRRESQIEAPNGAAPNCISKRHSRLTQPGDAPLQRTGPDEGPTSGLGGQGDRESREQNALRRAQPRLQPFRRSGRGLPRPGNLRRSVRLRRGWDLALLAVAAALSRSSRHTVSGHLGAQPMAQAQDGYRPQQHAETRRPEHGVSLLRPPAACQERAVKPRRRVWSRRLHADICRLCACALTVPAGGVTLEGAS